MLVRNEKGLFVPDKPALERFVSKCEFDPATGCVLWTGATTAGRGNSARYGSFWDNGRREFAHRWSAKNIHGLDIDGLTVGHCCDEFRPGKSNTLCVHHLKPETLRDNCIASNRARKVEQSGLTRQYWLLVSLGIEPPPGTYEPDPDAIPWYSPPDWYVQAKPALVAQDCPF